MHSSSGAIRVLLLTHLRWQRTDPSQGSSGRSSWMRRWSSTALMGLGELQCRAELGSSSAWAGRVPHSPKPRPVLLNSKTSAPCSATALEAAEESCLPCVMFVRRGSRTLAEVSLTKTCTFRPLQPQDCTFLCRDSSFLTSVSGSTNSDGLLLTCSAQCNWGQVPRA